MEIIVIVAFFLLLLIGVPLCMVFTSVSILPSLVDESFSFTIDAVTRAMFNSLNSFTIMAIPLFVFAGVIMTWGKISEKIFNLFAYFIGNKTAGLPCTVVLTCLVFGAISGSGPATVAAVGSMSIPFLVKLGYDKVFATSLVAISGGLGVIIPPSVPMIIYSISAGTSIAEMFLAGIFPGCLIALFLMGYAYIYCRKNGEDKEVLLQNYLMLRKDGIIPLLKDGVWALATPIIVLGSIYGGICSPTEAATISIFYSLFVSIFIYKTIKARDIIKILREGVRSYSAILFIIASAIAFSRVLVILGISTSINNALSSVITSKIVLLLLLNGVLLLVGMVVDVTPAILIFTPIMLPIAVNMGVDPIHFGIIMICNFAIAFVTPPMGINLFVASNMTGVSVAQIAKKVIPAIVAFLIALMIITFVEELSLFIIRL